MKRVGAGGGEGRKGGEHTQTHTYTMLPDLRPLHTSPLSPFDRSPTTPASHSTSFASAGKTTTGAQPVCQTTRTNTKQQKQQNKQDVIARKTQASRGEGKGKGGAGGGGEG